MFVNILKLNVKSYFLVFFSDKYRCAATQTAIGPRGFWYGLDEHHSHRQKGGDCFVTKQTNWPSQRGDAYRWDTIGKDETWTWYVNCPTKKVDAS